MRGNIDETKTMAENMDRLFTQSKLTNKEIAAAVGFTSNNMVSIIRAGDSRAPFKKLAVFAKTLGADPGELTSLALREYLPDIWLDIQNHILDGSFKTSDIDFSETVSENVDRLLRSSGAPLMETAMKAGFKSHKLLSMIRGGGGKLPLDKARALAVALKIHPGALLALGLKEYTPEVWELIDQHLMRR